MPTRGADFAQSDCFLVRFNVQLVWRVGEIPGSNLSALLLTGGSTKFFLSLKVEAFVNTKYRVGNGKPCSGNPRISFGNTVLNLELAIAN